MSRAVPCPCQFLSLLGPWVRLFCCLAGPDGIDAERQAMKHEDHGGAPVVGGAYEALVAVLLLVEQEILDWLRRSSVTRINGR